MKQIGITINGVVRDYLSALDEKYRDTFDNEPNYPVDLYDLDNSFPVEEIDRGDTLEFDPNFEPEYEYSEKLKRYIPKNTPDTLAQNDQSERKDQKSIYYFMYHEAPIPIFARAKYIENGIIQSLSYLNNSIEEEIVLISKENHFSKNATLMFLCADTQFDLNQIKFINNYDEYWENIDMLVTDNPVIMDIKPNDKQLIKLSKNYNTEYNADYIIESPNELIENKNNFFKVKDNVKE